MNRTYGRTFPNLCPRKDLDVRPSCDFVRQTEESFLEDGGREEHPGGPSPTDDAIDSPLPLLLRECRLNAQYLTSPYSTPSFIKHCCQDMLTAQWTRKLPIIQETAPAELAARLIHAFLDDFPDIDSEQYFVIDFCSGAGGKQIQKFYDLEAAMGYRDARSLWTYLCPGDVRAFLQVLHDALLNTGHPPKPKQAPYLTNQTCRSNTPYRKIRQQQQISCRPTTHPLPPLGLPPKPRRLDALSNPLRKPQFHTPTRRCHRHNPRTSLGRLQNILIT